MSVEMARAVIHELASLDDTRLTIAGVGDPLLCDGLFEILDLIPPDGSISVHVETDFLGATPETIRRLAGSPVAVVSVHLPAISPRIYERIMGVVGLEKVTAAIQEFVTARIGRNVPILVPTFVKCRQNLVEMEAWYDQWLQAVGCAVLRGPSDFAGQIPDIGVADMSPPRRKPCVRIASRMTIYRTGKSSRASRTFLDVTRSAKSAVIRCKMCG